MINIDANGKAEDYENGEAQGANKTVNDEEKKVTDALRTFTKSVRSIYGKESIVNLHTVGSADHGGVRLNVNLTVTNLRDRVSNDTVTVPAK